MLVGKCGLSLLKLPLSFRGGRGDVPGPGEIHHGLLAFPRGLLAVQGCLLTVQRGLLLDDLLLQHASLHAPAEGHFLGNLIPRASGHGIGGQGPHVSAAVGCGGRVKKSINSTASRRHGHLRPGTLMMMKNAAERSARQLTQFGLLEFLVLPLARGLLFLKGDDALDGIGAEGLVLRRGDTVLGYLGGGDAVAHGSCGEFGLHDSIVGVVQPHQFLAAS
mmetsp:Transcript_26073/g.54399  ORF Transcript_26073/g.54399 Transcript_26073/m.54399 type:complete len:219 (-) Transcript_26073:594-1250(-)